MTREEGGRRGRGMEEGMRMRMMRRRVGGRRGDEKRRRKRREDVGDEKGRRRMRKEDEQDEKEEDGEDDDEEAAENHGRKENQPRNRSIAPVRYGRNTIIRRADYLSSTPSLISAQTRPGRWEVPLGIIDGHYFPHLL